MESILLKLFPKTINSILAKKCRHLEKILRDDTDNLHPVHSCGEKEYGRIFADVISDEAEEHEYNANRKCIKSRYRSP